LGISTPMDQVKEIQARLDHFDAVQKYKKAEEQLDDLLFTISKTIAHSVSDMIKVPSNVSPEAGDCSSGGCSTGGGCSGKCG
jgi:O-phosphoseryl-tRNA(Cys) synthetase